MVVARRLTPEKTLRFISFFCFIGAGLSVIFLASHDGSGSGMVIGIQDLVSYFFVALGIFVFFYVQYRLVPHFTKRTLNARLGYWQALGGLALLLVGVFHELILGEYGVLPSLFLWLIALVGEFVFVLNVVWSYTHGDVRASTTQQIANLKDSDFGWPKSPTKLFGIAAIFFGAIGILSTTLGLPSFKVPLPWGTHLHLIPIGWLWLGAATPFGVFTLLYQLLLWLCGTKVQQSFTRLHFAVTIIAVLGLSRLYVPWQRAMATEWLVALLGASTVIFAINAVRTFWPSTASNPR